MINQKVDIQKSLSPKAILIPLTQEATDSIIQMNYQSDIISILEFPFRVGREARIDKNERGFFLKFRLFKTKKDSKPTNDAYLVDKSSNSQIEKEHFLIDRVDNLYILKDRGTKYGTTINETTLNIENNQTELVLNDGDIIKVGSKDSEFKFQFLILEI